MTEKQLAERVAVLEERSEATNRLLEQVNEKLDAMKNDLNRYRGAWGMLTLLFGALAAVLPFVKGWFGASR